MTTETEHALYLMHRDESSTNVDAADADYQLPTQLTSCQHQLAPSEMRLKLRYCVRASLHATTTRCLAAQGPGIVSLQT